MTERTEIPNKNVLPLLPLKGTVIMPHQVAPLGVGRPKSLRALETALAGDRMILLAAQKQDDQENPTPADIYPVGTICKILQVGKQPDGVRQVIVEGVVRADLLGVEQIEPYFEMRVAPRPDSVEKNLETEALMRGVVSQFERFARFSRSVAPEQYAAAMQADEPGKLADLVSQHLPLKLEERQQLLELAPKDRLELLSQVLTREVNILELERKIQNRVRKQMEKSQREYFLKEQMKAIQQELGESDERQSEVAEYKKKIEAANLPEHVKEKALEELSRLEKMPPMVAEAVVVRTYLDWLLAVPWAVRTEDRLDITEVGVDWPGDPRSALLEALDPEQNHSFSDHYLEIPLDLSEVMFICTGNILDTIPPALRDRVEVIRFPGYIEEEKLKIATQFLIAKQRKENGLTADQVAMTGEALRHITREYTREAGVRNLEREIASVFCKVATEIATGRATAVKVTAARLHRFLA